MLAMSNMINAAAGSVNTLFVAGNTSTFASENEALAVIKAAIGEIKEDWSVLPFAEGDEIYNSVGIAVFNSECNKVGIFSTGDIPVEGAQPLSEEAMDAMVYVLRLRIAEGVAAAKADLEIEAPIVSIDAVGVDIAEEEGCNFDQAADFIDAYNRVIGDVNIASAFRIVSFATWRTDYVNSYIF